MQSQRKRSGLTVSWGGLENILKHFPRIRYRNIIMSCEKWIIDSNAFRAGKKLDAVIFRKLCHNNGICRHLRFTEGDNTLYVDVDSDSSVNAFFSAVRNSRKIVLEEFLPTEPSILEKMNISTVNECLIPLVVTRV